MENGKWDEANEEKVRLEEKQRAARRKREAEAEQAAAKGNLAIDEIIGLLLLVAGRPYEPYAPVWFAQTKEEDSDTISHVYKGTYWQCKEKQDWSMCPDIF